MNNKIKVFTRNIEREEVTKAGEWLVQHCLNIND